MDREQLAVVDRKLGGAWIVEQQALWKGQGRVDSQSVGDHIMWVGSKF